MAIVSILLNAQLIELYSRKKKSTSTFIYTNAHEIEDPYKLGFFFLLKGKCNLVFEVLKLRRAADNSRVQSPTESRDGE